MTIRVAELGRLGGVAGCCKGTIDIRAVFITAATGTGNDVGGTGSERRDI